MDCSFFFLAAVPLLHASFSSRAAAIDKAATTAADFAMLVWGIPHDATEEVIRAHFDRFRAPPPELPPPQLLDSVQSQGQRSSTQREQESKANVGDSDLRDAGEGAEGRSLEAGGEQDGKNYEDPVVAFVGTSPSPNSTCKVPGMKTPNVEARGAAEAVGEENMDGVAEVFIARRDRRVLEGLRQLAALQDALDDLRYALAKNPPPAAAARAKAKVDKLESRLLVQATKIRRLRQGSGRAAVCAFVVFRSEAARDACIQEYTGRGSRMYTRECWGQRMDLRLGGLHRLKVVRAVEPSDVLWENLECPW